MLVTLTRIVIEQDNTKYSARTKKFTFNFVNQLKIVSSWANLTDTAELVFPKNIYFVDEGGKKVNWQGQNTIGDTLNPLLLRGDKITISLGYIYTDKLDNQAVQMNEEFKGYITKVVNRIPIKITCEDNMYLLKQVLIPNKVFSSKTYTLQKMIAEMLELVPGKPFTNVSTTVTNNFQTNIGEFRTQGETIAKVLERLRKDYHVESYFRGNELRCSGFVYYPNDLRKHIFKFQENIITDNLEYRRKDDIRIGATVISINEEDQQQYNEYGYVTKKQKRLESFVGDRNGELIKTLHFLNVKTKAELERLGQEQLNRQYYEGFFGTFTTFGLPSVRHGDAAVFIDPLPPNEREGTYLIKQVEKSMNVNEGFKQTITIDIRLDQITEADRQLGL